MAENSYFESREDFFRAMGSTVLTKILHKRKEKNDSNLKYHCVERLRRCL